jgi:hypothetical protein
MRDVEAYDGVITLKRFKLFFYRNNLDQKVLSSTIQCLEKDVFQWKNLPITGARDGIPKLWLHSVISTKKELTSGETDERKGIPVYY